MKFKNNKDKENMLLLHPILLQIMFDMNLWCYERNLPFNVTSTISTIHEDKKLGRTSDSHRTGRAIDVSLRGWDHLAVGDFVTHFNRRYYNVAAIASDSGKPTLIPDVRHGSAPHFHIQVAKKFATKEHLEKIKKYLKN
jgi:hypothetical protein